MDPTEPAGVAYEVVTYVAYDATTGEILLSHRHSFLSGRPRRSREHVEASVLRESARLAGRPEKELAVLALDGVERAAGAVHKVDVANKTLIVVQNPRRLRQP